MKTISDHGNNLVNKLTYRHMHHLYFVLFSAFTDSATTIHESSTKEKPTETFIPELAYSKY